MASQEPNFDISDLPGAGMSVKDLQADMVDAIEQGQMTFPETDEHGYEIEAEAAPAEAEAATEEAVEEEAPAEEAEASAETEEEAAEEEAAETDDTSYPMPELLSFEGEEAGIEIDGEFASLQTLKDSHYRQADYSRDMDRTREERKNWVDQSNTVAEQQQQYHASLGQLETLINAQLPTDRTQAQWDQLESENPQAFIAETKRMRENEATLRNINAEQGRVSAEYDKGVADRKEAALADLGETLQTTVPGWSDPATMESEASELVGWLAEEFDMTQDERAGMVDARFWQLAHMAHKYQQVANGAVAVEKKARPLSKATLKAGRAVTTSERAAAKTAPLDKAEKRARSTQDIHDWENFFGRAAAAGGFD